MKMSSAISVICKLLSITNLFCFRLVHLNLDRGQGALLCVFISIFFISPLILFPCAVPEPLGTEQGQRRGNRQRHGNDASWPVELCSADVHELNYSFLERLRGLLGASTGGNLFNWECPQVRSSSSSLWHEQCFPSYSATPVTSLCCYPAHPNSSLLPSDVLGFSGISP